MQPPVTPSNANKPMTTAMINGNSKPDGLSFTNPPRPARNVRTEPGLSRPDDTAPRPARLQRRSRRYRGHRLHPCSARRARRAFRHLPDATGQRQRPEPDLRRRGAQRPRVTTPSAGTEGAALLFAWHWLGGSPEQFNSYFGLQAKADELGAVIVVPHMPLDSNAFEWEFVNESEHDVVLFRRPAQLPDHPTGGTDIQRVYTTGVSAGALWSSYLSIHRADSLSAAR